MSENDDSSNSYASHWLKRQTALGWYRRLVVLALAYSLLVTILAVVSLFAMLNRPYGGFFWSWDNSHGIYKVDSLSVEETSDLQIADFILGVEGYSGSPVEIRRLAQSRYDSATSVCQKPQDAPVVIYRIRRRGEEIPRVPSRVRCFDLVTLVRSMVIPLPFGLLVWVLGVSVYRAAPNEELNLVFALGAAWLTNVLAGQSANVPGIETVLGQIVAVVVTNPSPILMIATLYHLITILPRQHPSRLLCRTRGLWYGLAPVLLLALGTMRFQLGVNWHPWVGILDRVVSWGTVVYLLAGIAVLVIRYWWIYTRTSSRQAKNQVRLISLSAMMVFVAILFMFPYYEPHLARWIPMRQGWLLAWWVLVFTSFAFAILRYQVFRKRVKRLNILLVLAVSIGIAFAFSLVPRLGPEMEFVILLTTVVVTSLFWVLPNPVQRLLQRLASPGTIEREDIEQFSADIQGIQDIDTLPLVIVQSLEHHLELSFAALWIERETGLLTLETYTDQAPAADLPSTLATDTVWQEQPTRLLAGVLANVGCRIVLPLVAGGTRIGLLALGQRWTEEVFDETDLVALGVMADQAALALQTAYQVQTLRLVPLQVEQAQLDERDRIAQDLHDSTQAHLAQMAFALERIRGHLYAGHTRAEGLLEECIQDTNRAARELRAILRNLIPERLMGQRLIDTLQKYINSARTLHGATCIDLQANPQIEHLLSPEKKLALLRICQQALDNALVHARAQSVCITLQPDRDQDVIEFSIVDDGRGFIRRPTGDFVKRGHHGLHIMESRAIQYQGRLEIEATPGQGTVVKGYLPCAS